MEGKKRTATPRPNLHASPVQNPSPSPPRPQPPPFTTPGVSFLVDINPDQDPELDPSIREDCQRALSCLRKGITEIGFQIIQESMSRHPNSVALLRTRAFMHFHTAMAFEMEITRRLQHLRDGAASAEQALALRPKLIGLRVIYTSSLFELAKEKVDYVLVIKQCQKGLLIQDPVDPEKDLTVYQKETEVEDRKSKEARIESAERELCLLIRRSNEITIKMENSSEDDAAEEKNSGRRSPPLKRGQACAACKFQRRRCSKDCPLAPHFPADQQKTFQAVHRLFGVSKIIKILKELPPELHEDAMKSIKYESEIRTTFPVDGCLGVTWHLLSQKQQLEEELRRVRARIDVYEDLYHLHHSGSHDLPPYHHHQHAIGLPMNDSMEWQLPDDVDDVPPYHHHHQHEIGLPMNDFLFNGGANFVQKNNDMMMTKDYLNNFGHSHAMAAHEYPIQHEMDVPYGCDDIPFDSIEDERESYNIDSKDATKPSGFPIASSSGISYSGTSGESRKLENPLMLPADIVEDGPLMRLIESEGMTPEEMIENQRRIEDEIKQNRLQEQNKDEIKQYHGYYSA